MLTKGEEHTDQGQDYYEERYRERVLRALSQRAAKLGMPMVPSNNPPENLIPDQSLGFERPHRQTARRRMDRCADTWFEAWTLLLQARPARRSHK
jgi:hypothetical protein